MSHTKADEERAQADQEEKLRRTKHVCQLATLEVGLKGKVLRNGRTYGGCVKFWICDFRQVDHNFEFLLGREFFSTA
jgi:hypothetical protein